MARYLFRARRRMRRLTGDRAPRFVYSRRYSRDFPDPLFDAKRALRILHYLESQKLLSPRDLHRARMVSLVKLRTVHDESYLESLQESGALTRVLGFEVPDSLQDEILTTQRAMVGGTILATRLAMDSGQPAVNLGGGLHHARPDRGQGYCVFNDVAVAVAQCRAEGFAGAVLIIDLDLHDGEGTRACFAADSTVHTFSVHNQDLPPQDAIASTSIALGPNIGDELYLETLTRHLPPLFEQVKPQLVYYLAGSDPAADDKLGNWRITPQGLLARDQLVIRERNRQPAPPAVVILLAGGYGRGSWRYSARFFSWLLTGSTALEPPLTLELPLTHYRRRFHHLSQGPILPEPELQDWALSAEDLLPLGQPKRSRLLDYYSAHAVELALDRSGLLDKVRRMGFRDLRVEMDLSDPMGDTLRLLSAGQKMRVLIELRVRRDLRTIASMQLLAVEWLLLQDSRRTFILKRPRRPGQEHPGLGLLQDVATLLLLACERLDLDGLIFTATHFHLAAQAQATALFLKPEVEGRFRALLECLRPLDLITAVSAVDEGRVVDRRTAEIVRWIPEKQILPVSDRLRQFFTQADYRARVAAAAASTDFMLQADA